MDDAPSGSSDVIRRIKVAAIEVDAAKRESNAEILKTAQVDLRALIRAAVDAGTSWQAIGDALSLRRGAAYQRYRRKAQEV